MSYRTVKRLLGETSLERKCRFLFGGGLLLLITGSFYFYGRQTTKLVYEQNIITGRLLVTPVIYQHHWKYRESKLFHDAIDAMARELTPAELGKSKWDLLRATPDDPERRPSEQADFDALDRLAQGNREIGGIVANEQGESWYRYYGAVRASESCIKCHRHDQAKVGDLIGMAKISFPVTTTEKSMAWNNAILLATAVGTAFLAMVAAYAIVRYVIVKPVLHLKEVSDSISRNGAPTSAPATSSRSSARRSIACCGTWWPCRRNCGRSTACSTARSTNWPRPTCGCTN
jgi:two-component system, NarL family, sensor histidine kinase BarA